MSNRKQTDIAQIKAKPAQQTRKGKFVGSSISNKSHASCIIGNCNGQCKSVRS